MYKLSKYNFVIEINPDSYLVYNALSNSLYETKNLYIIKLLQVETDSILMPENWQNNLLKEEIIELISGNYIIASNIQELEILKKRREFYLSYLSSINELSFTIGVTNQCNMACSYCYEGKKPSSGYFTEKSANDLLTIIRREIQSPSYIKKVKKLTIFWFGGEPLMKIDIIERFSSEVIKICDKYGIEYKSEITTNGVLLDENAIRVFEKYKVTTIQVTLDGDRTMHNRKRPLLYDNGNGSFDNIINNLKLVPENIRVVIRVNCDKQVVKSLHNLLTELEKNELWPQKARQFSLSLAAKRISSKNKYYLSSFEFFEASRQFTEMKLTMYNKWAKENGLSLAKRKFVFPNSSKFLCLNYHNPFALVINQNGDISNCMEYLNSSKYQLCNISEGLLNLKQLDKFTNMLNYDIIELNPKCQDCKFLPICDKMNCSIRHSYYKGEECTHWKYHLENILKSQYELSVESPSEIQPISEINLEPLPFC